MEAEWVEIGDKLDVGNAREESKFQRHFLGLGLNITDVQAHEGREFHLVGGRHTVNLKLMFTEESDQRRKGCNTYAALAKKGIWCGFSQAMQQRHIHPSLQQKCHRDKK